VWEHNASIVFFYIKMEAVYISVYQTTQRLSVQLPTPKVLKCGQCIAVWQVQDSLVNRNHNWDVTVYGGVSGSSEKLIVSHLLRNFLASYETRRFVPVSSRTRTGPHPLTLFFQGTVEYCPSIYGSQDSVVGIATDYGLNDRVVGVRFTLG
jgi:hypothetical protein